MLPEALRQFDLSFRVEEGVVVIRHRIGWDPPPEITSYDPYLRVGHCAIAVAAALFGVHPLHVESVAWVSERKDVLSTFFGLLALLAYAGYAERPGPWRYLLVAVPFALGLMSKPMLVTLPCVLLLLDYWPLRRFAPNPHPSAHLGHGVIIP